MRSTIAFCTSMAQRTASTTLRNSTSAPSPVRLTTRPLWTAIVGSRRRRERPRRPFAAVEPVEHFHQRRDRPDVALGDELASSALNLAKANPRLRPLHLVVRETEFCGLRLAGYFRRRMRENSRNSVRRPRCASLTRRNYGGFCLPGNRPGLSGLHGGGRSLAEPVSVRKIPWGQGILQGIYPKTAFCLSGGRVKHRKLRTNLCDRPQIPYWPGQGIAGN